MQKVERVGHLDEDPEFYSKKRELMAENSLADASTQIERISNLISSYPARIRTWTKRTKISCATVTLPGIGRGFPPHPSLTSTLAAILR